MPLQLGGSAERDEFRMPLSDVRCLNVGEIS
jgi:hypothetical protein